MVRRALSLVYTEIRGLHQAAYLLALFAFGSQILAIVRDRTLAHTFGAGSELDMYYAAFRVPDLLFVVFTSVLSVYVLLPFVERRRAAAGAAAAASVLAQCFTLFLYCYTAVAIILFVTAPVFLPWVFPGLAGDSETLVWLTRILLLQPFFLGLSSLLGVVTQAERRFVLYAVSPMLYNVGIIIGAVVLYPWLGLPGLAWGVVLGAVAHWGIQYPLVRRSPLSFSWSLQISGEVIKEVVVRALPRSLTLATHQLAIFVLVAYATTFTVGSVAVFQFAFNLQSVPLVIVGMSYSVAAFPLLAEFVAKDDRVSFNRHVMSALRHIIFWSVPIIGLVIVLRAQLVRVLFGSGSFDWSDTRLVAAILALLVVSLLAQAVLLLLVRAYYAAGKLWVPFLVSLFGLVATLGSAVGLRALFIVSTEFRQLLESLFRISDVPGTEVLVLALGFTLGMILEALILFILFARTFTISIRSLWRLAAESTLAALAGAGVAYVVLNFIVDGVNQNTFIGIVLQGVVAGVAGVIAVVLVYYAIGSRELHELYRSFHSRIFKTEVLTAQSDTV